LAAARKGHVRTVLTTSCLAFAAGQVTCISHAALVTFSVRGQMKMLDADFAIGDKFTGSFTFESTAGFVAGTPPTLTRQYLAITAWELMFDRGYKFVHLPSAPFATISLGNDTSYGDRYVVNMPSATSIGTPLPSGRTLNSWQINFLDPWDYGADLLSNDLLPTTFPDIDLVIHNTGTFAFSNNSQQSFGLIPVPEPTTGALLLLAGIGWCCRRRD